MHTHQERTERPVSSGIIDRWHSWAPVILSITRIVAAFVFMQSGTMKLLAYPMGVPPNNGTVELWSQAGIGGLLEIVGGALLVVGLFSRTTAFILSGEMAVAYFQFHQPMNFWPVINMGIPALLYCFLWLYISAAGPGPWSIDAVRARRTVAYRAPSAGSALVDSV